jgi:hypothetical protein
MKFGILVKFHAESEPMGLLLHFCQEPTMAEVETLVSSSLVGGFAHSWFVHEVNSSKSDAADWRARNS